MQRLSNPFVVPGRWYKANLHTHSTISDGALSPAERVEQYRKAGYSVLALTDHRKTQDIAGLGDTKILVVSGIEVHPVCHDPKGWWHVVGVGVPRTLSFVDPPASVNRTVSRIRAAGGAAILAHPAWCGQDFHSFAHIRGLDAIEVWNATCDRAGRASSETEWANALDAGWRVPCVAVDDCHCAHTDDVCEGWTWLKMPALTEKEVVEAIRTGACYASRGPTIHDFRIEKGVLRLSCSPAGEIHFKAQPGVGKRRRAEGEESLTSFELPLKEVDSWPWTYVRAVVTDRSGKKAWTGAICPSSR